MITLSEIQTRFLVSPLAHTLWTVGINEGFTALNQYPNALSELAKNSFQQEDTDIHMKFYQIFGDALCCFDNQHLHRLHADTETALKSFEPNQPWSLRKKSCNPIEQRLLDPEKILSQHQPLPEPSYPLPYPLEEGKKFDRLVDRVKRLDQYLFSITDKQEKELLTRCWTVVTTLRNVSHHHRIPLLQKGLELLVSDVSQIFEKELQILEENTRILQFLLSKKKTQAPIDRKFFEEKKAQYIISLTKELFSLFSFSQSADTPELDLPLPKGLWKWKILASDPRLDLSQDEDLFQRIWKQLIRLKLIETFEMGMKTGLVAREHLSNMAVLSGTSRGALAQYVTRIVELQSHYLHSHLRRVVKLDDSTSIREIPVDNFKDIVQKLRHQDPKLELPTHLMIYLLFDYLVNLYTLRTTLENALEMPSRHDCSIKLNASSSTAEASSYAAQIDLRQLFRLNQGLTEAEAHVVGSLSLQSPMLIKLLYSLQPDDEKLKTLEHTLLQQNRDTPVQDIVDALGIRSKSSPKEQQSMDEGSDPGSIEPETAKSLQALNTQVSELFNVKGEEEKPKFSLFRRLLPSNSNSPAPASSDSNSVLISRLTRQDRELDIKANPAKVSKFLNIPKVQILLPQGDKIDHLQPMNAVLVDRLIPSIKRLHTALEVFNIHKTDKLRGNLKLLCEILDTYIGTK